MPKDWVELKSIRIPFDSMLNLITKTIAEHNGFILPERFKSQKNVNIKLLRWLVDQNVIEIKYRASKKERLPATYSIKSRKRKIEISLQHNIVKDLLKFFQEYGIKAYGMSSFGPSVIAITETVSEAEKLRSSAEEFLKDIGGHFYICNPNNTGAKIEYLD